MNWYTYAKYMGSILSNDELWIQGKFSKDKLDRLVASGDGDYNRIISAMMTLVDAGVISMQPTGSTKGTADVPDGVLPEKALAENDYKPYEDAHRMEIFINARKRVKVVVTRDDPMDSLMIGMTHLSPVIDIINGVIVENNDREFTVLDDEGKKHPIVKSFVAEFQVLMDDWL